MIEYLYDAIRAVAGQDIEINAKITNDDDMLITENCELVIHFRDGDMKHYPGTYIPELGEWSFTVPGEDTLGIHGKHFYCIQRNNQNLCFKTPLFLV
jgi:hypothetical protein